MQIKMLLFILGISWLSISMAAPQQFKDVTSMMHEFNDYPSDIGAFKIIREKPLSIQISPKVLSTESWESIQSRVRQAAVYGAYRTLLQTPEESVSVTVIPLSFHTTIHQDTIMHQKTYLKEHELNFRITRIEALKLAYKYSGIASASELIQSNGYRWADSFSKCCYAIDMTSIFHKFFTELISLHSTNRACRYQGINGAYQRVDYLT